MSAQEVGFLVTQGESRRGTDQVSPGAELRRFFRDIRMAPSALGPFRHAIRASDRPWSCHWDPPPTEAPASCRLGDEVPLRRGASMRGLRPRAGWKPALPARFTNIVLLLSRGPSFTSPLSACGRTASSDGPFVLQRPRAPPLRRVRPAPPATRGGVPRSARTRPLPCPPPPDG